MGATTPGQGHLRDLVPTGIDGLNEILHGGLPRGGIYTVEGPPGAGKTTLALQFLLAGRDRGETALHVSLSETEEELRAIARSHGWSLDRLHIFELVSGAGELARPTWQTMFPPAEAELEEMMRPLLDQVERLCPSLVVLDSITELRLLAREPLRYRHQLLAMKRYFRSRDCTVLLLDEAQAADTQTRTIAHGVIGLDVAAPDYGSPRRQLTVEKLRGAVFSGGRHDFRIQTGGLEVYPRVTAGHFANAPGATLSSGVAELDALLGGGLSHGTSTLLIGAAGTGKSTLAAQFAASATAAGGRAAMFLFAETPGMMLSRAAALGMGLESRRRDGSFMLRSINPAEVSAGQFSHEVRTSVERDRARLLVLDSINEYFQSVPGEQFLALHLAELLRYLAANDVVTIMLLAQRGLVGAMQQLPIDVSYLADTVLLLRFFEARGEVRQAVSVLKKRSGPHERTIREYRIGRGGLVLGPPLQDFENVLSGSPRYQGDRPLLGEDNHDGG